jgi:hypothetical protein
VDDVFRHSAHVLHAVSLAGVGLCLGLWIRAKTVTQDVRGNAERRALFVGLWPVQLWLMGDAAERYGAAQRDRDPAWRCFRRCCANWRATLSGSAARRSRGARASSSRGRRRPTVS